jgi:predicted nuclease of restriction endonuclease-like (RecB) superfamily
MAERTSRHRYSPEVINLRYPAFGAYCDCLDWQIGHELSRRRGEWGLGVIGRASQDLRAAFPDMQGFSPTNLKYMRAFAEAWPDFEDRQRTVGELPWGHNVTLVTWLESEADRVAYAQAALTHGWSRTVLDHHIDLRTVDRLGKAQTNFESTLPKPTSDLARENLKDPYRFDFLGLGDEALEREIESALMRHITQFLLELGAGFAFVGRQKLLDVGGEEFFVDLLFYHLKLRCYIVIELKGGKFKPEHIGQLGFYLSAIDGQVKAPDDAPTIGLLLCKTKNQVVAEYALRSSASPIGLAEYRLVESLPRDLEASLPSIERIEEALSGAEALVPKPRSRRRRSVGT